MTTPKFKALEEELNNLQKMVIGIFKFRGFQYMVVRNVDGLLDCVDIGSLGGFNETHINIEQGQYFPFPDGQNLYDFKFKNPFGLRDFMDKIK